MSCARCGGELEEGDLRCPVCALAVPVQAAARERVEARIVRCKACGASLAWSAEAAAPRCAFCDSVMQVEVAADPPEQAEFYLPFRVTPAQAQAALSAFLHQKAFFRPGDLGKASTLDSLKPMWWPAWIFNARALISWSADSDAGSGRSKWAPHAGVAQAAFDFITVSASRGLHRAECDALTPRYDLRSRAASPQGPEGAQVERFDANRSGARRLILEAIQAEAQERVRPQIPGSSVRNLHTAVLLEGLDTDRFALPAYVLAYRYRHKLYRVVLHGQDPECLIGKAPISGWKVLLAVLMALGGAALVLALVALFANQ